LILLATISIFKTGKREKQGDCSRFFGQMFVSAKTQRYTGFSPPEKLKKIINKREC
jgi:hypothetical protein